MSKKKKGKKINEVLLVPGPQGWDVWEVGSEHGASLKVRTETVRALEVEGLPSRDLHMAFPVREVSSLPMKSPTTDAALFADMAEMHIERMGMRPPIEMGNLSDFFLVTVREEESLLLPVVLAPPPEGSLPPKSPQSFDVSARCFELPVDAVAIWRELGRWVFAVSDGANLLHFQAMATLVLGEKSGREIAMTLTQLQLQGLLEGRPEHCFVWLAEDELAPANEQVESLAEGFGGQATVAVKPNPRFPENSSALLPADTRAERVAKRKRQQATIAIAAVVLAYLGSIAWLAWNLYDETRDARIAQIAADVLKDGAGGLEIHSQKWNELIPITEVDHWPVELLFRCAEAIPKSAGTELRFTRAEFYNQLEFKDNSTALIRSIRIQGEAAELEQVNQFNLNLKRSQLLASYDWTTPTASETNTGAWSFFYDADFDLGGTN